MTLSRRQRFWKRYRPFFGATLLVLCVVFDFVTGQAHLFSTGLIIAFLFVFGVYMLVLHILGRRADRREAQNH